MRHRPIDQFIYSFGPILRLRGLSGMMLAAVALLLIVGGAKAMAFDAVVVHEKAPIRAGAGPSYYVVGHATKGQPIQVLRIVHGWYELEPTKDVSLYFEKDQLQVSENGATAETRRAGLTGYLASVEGPGASTWAGPPLEKGAQLTVLGEEGGYYRVAPPKGTVVYLAPGAVRRLLPDEAVPTPAEPAATVEPAVNNEPADTVEGVEGDVREELVDAAGDAAESAATAEQVLSEVAEATGETAADAAQQAVVEGQATVPMPVAADSGSVAPQADVTPRITPRRQGPGAAAVEGSSTGSPGVSIARPERDAVIVEGRTTQSRAAIELDGVDAGLPEAASPRVEAVEAADEQLVEAVEAAESVGAAADADPLTGREDIGAVDPALRKLEAETIAMLEQPLEQQQLDELKKRYEAMSSRDDLSRSDGWIVRARLAQLSRNQRLKAALAGLKQAQAEAAPEPVKPEQPAEAAAPAPKPKPIYTHSGLLVASGVYDGTKLPQLYRLVDPISKRTIAYVRPGELIQPRRALGRRVGIIGEAEEDPQLGIRVIEPTTVDVIQP